MGQTDTDEDGLTDGDEVQWNYVELKEDGSFTLKDSDDGLEDKDDEYPFINSIVKCWYKFELQDKDVYIAQEKHGESNTVVKIYEKGSNVTTLYKFIDGSWKEVERNVPIPDDDKKLILSDGDINSLNSSDELVVNIYLEFEPITIV